MLSTWLCGLIKQLAILQNDKMRLQFLFLLVLTCHLSFGQGKSLVNLISYSMIDCPVNKVYHSFNENKKTYVISDTRQDGDLNILISIFDEEGILIDQKVIGKKNTFDRPVKLTTCFGEVRYLLSNIFEGGESQLILYTLNKNFSIISEQKIAIDGLSEGTDMIVEQDLATISVSILDDAGNLFPSVLSYNLRIQKIESQFNLPIKNSVVSNREDLFPNNKLYKKNNEIKSLKPNNEYLLVGYENNEFVTDFWACKIQQEKVEWEKMYYSEIGGDEGMNVFMLDSGKFILSGIGYTKRKDENYMIRSILLNGKGDVVKEQYCKEKTRTFYRGGRQINSDYIVLLGQAENVEYTSVNSKVSSSSALIVIYNQTLDEVFRKDFETINSDEILDIVVFSNERFGVIYKLAGKTGLMKFQLN